MKHFQYLLKEVVAVILQARRSLLQHILLRLCCVLFAAATINTPVLAKDTAPEVKKISATEAFLQGQQYIEQANIALAELSLTRIPSASPYAKLLAGNIATHKGEYERAFLLLLPLQSNQTLIKSATASLHNSLSRAYEKQGDTINALDQLIRKETCLENPAAINTNHEHIWQLVSGLALQDLITMRGESTSTTTQGWVDLGLAYKNQHINDSINTWLSSYSDHIASDFAKKLLTQRTDIVNSGNADPTNKLPSNGSIAVILPLETPALPADTEAFIQGLQAALNHHALQNVLRVYSSQNNTESVQQQYELAKSEGAEYFIAPPSIATADGEAYPGTSMQTELPLDDEAQTIATFAASNAFQHMTIITSDDETAGRTLNSMQSAWKNASGKDATVITVARDLKAGDDDLLNLKAKISSQVHDILVLAASAQHARTIKPYLDISTPVFAFSNVHEIAGDTDSNALLNGVRFIEIPFLLKENEARFDLYHQLSTSIKANDLLRAFALGVDHLQQLIIHSQNNEHELIVNGLTGQLNFGKDGSVQRQLSVARFTYDGVVSEK